MNLSFENTPLDGVKLIKPSSYEDHRGWLTESYNDETFAQNGISFKVLQEKHSFSRNNVMRGMHFQRYPHAQGKLVRCSFGSIFDVVVDIRRNSDTFGKWFGTELSFENKYQLYVPPGFAHGFVVTGDTGACFSYLITHSHFNKEHDAGINFNDAAIGIQWPVKTEDMIISDKDREFPLLNSLDGI